MTEREAFIAAIAAEPGDDTARLAFADFLQERGEETRAEFVRLSCELAHRPKPPSAEDFGDGTPPDPNDPLRARITRLLLEHWHEWFGDLVVALGMPAPEPVVRPKELWGDWRYGPYVLNEWWLPHALPIVPAGGFDPETGQWLEPSQFQNELHLDRGFVTGLRASLAFRSGGCSLADALRLEPIDTLHLELDADPDLWADLSHPSCRRVRGLHLSLAPYHDPAPDFSDAADRLLNDDNLSGVRELSFFGAAEPHEEEYPGPPLPAGMAEALMSSAVGRGIESLRTRLEPGDLHAFADAEALPALRRLSLTVWSNVFGGGEIWMSLPQYRGLEELDLFGRFDLGALAGRPWARLRSLSVEGSVMGADAGAALGQAGLFLALERLRVSCDGTIDLRELTEALRAGRFPRLTMLALSGAPVTGSVVELAEAVAPTGVKRLNLFGVSVETFEEYDRVCGLLGDRVRISEPHDPNDDPIPF
ncbi:MAG: TIGR02996 domain-containing protein [Gemmataceae bacterium]|nr:TIGR02996 domain-containing protein [Gemmataceae bacterium]